MAKDIDTENRLPRLGWTAGGIVGWIFLPTGVIFLALGLSLPHAPGIIQEDRDVFLYVFGAVGAVFLLTSLILLGIDWRSRSRMRTAVRDGMRVTATLAQAQVIRSVNVGGTHPVRAVCRWTDPDTGQERTYYSRYLYRDFSALIEGMEVPLYVERGNAANGYVDIDAVLY